MENDDDDDLDEKNDPTVNLSDFGGLNESDSEDDDGLYDFDEIQEEQNLL